MPNAKALRALEYVQRYFDKQAFDYMDEQLEIIRAHLTDTGYARVPEGQHLMPSAFLQEYLELLEQSDFKEIHKLVRRNMVEAMLAAATGESHE